MNWGKGIALAIIAFIVFIASFVYKAFQNDFDLVRDDYYEHEVKFDEHKEAMANYNALNEEIQISQLEEGIQFAFPSKVNSNSTGEITFYRPDAKKYDRSFPLALDSENVQLLDYEHFREGYYDVRVEWESNGDSYIFEDDIQF